MDLELSDSIYSKEKPLSQMRVAITAIDLEQSEHRGIAYLSKGLISSINDGSKVKTEIIASNIASPVKTPK